MAADPNPVPAEADPDSGPAGLPARAAALDLLQAALERRGGFDEALALPGFTRLGVRERAWARGLAATTLRRLGPIDLILGERLRRPPPPYVHNILRLGAAQLLFRDTPAFAAVATSVDLAGRRKESRPFKGLVNAVLRALAREAPREFPPETHAPGWLYARWRTAYGEERARAIAAAIRWEPPTDLSFRAPDGAETWAAELEGRMLPGGSVRTERRGELSQWPGYAAGDWWVQDAAAALPARLLGLHPGQTALDMCAAPGGKTLQIASAGAATTALDRSAARLERLRRNLQRTGLEAEIHVADAGAWEDPRDFDAVLLDAPCTATGTFRRRPDVLWACRPGDVAKLVEVQARLLDAAAERVRPEGRLVYCVCSLEPEEGESQAAALLKRRPDFAIEPIREGDGGAPAEALRPEGWLRLTPEMWEPAGGIDGFFVARFRRAS